MDDVLRIVSACTAELEATAVAKGWHTLTELDFERAMWNATGARSATLPLRGRRRVASVDVLLPDRTALELKWENGVLDVARDVSMLRAALAEDAVARAFVVGAATLSVWDRAGGWLGDGGGALPVMLGGEPFRIRVAEVEPLADGGGPRIERLPVELVAYDDAGETVLLFFAAAVDDIAEVVVSDSDDVVAITLFERRVTGSAAADGDSIGCLELEVCLDGRRLIDGSDGTALRERNAADAALTQARSAGCPRWVP